MSRRSASARIVALLIVGALAVSVLSACADALSLSTRNRTDHEAVQKRTYPALLLMVPQDSADNDASLLEIVDSLKALNPSVEISVTLSSHYDTDLADALISDRPPDVFLATGSMLPELATGGVIAPISADWIERGQLWQAAAQGIEFEGKSYCFPHTIHTLALLYNVDLFEEAGVQLPTTDWDWDNLSAAASLLTDPDKGTVGLVFDPSPLSWLPFYLQAGGELALDDKGDAVFSTDAGETAASIVAGYISDGVAATPAGLGKTWSGDAFASGQVGMTITGDWILPYLSSNTAPFTYAVTELPRGPIQAGNVAFTNCLAVHAQSLNVDLALQLADQLTAPQVLKRWTGGEADALSVYSEQDIVEQPGRSHANPYLRALRYATPWRIGDFVERYAGRFEEGLSLVSDEEIQAEEFWPYLLRGGFPATSP